MNDFHTWLVFVKVVAVEVTETLTFATVLMTGTFITIIHSYRFAKAQVQSERLRRRDAGKDEL
jgi:hypothetical protein